VEKGTSGIRKPNMGKEPLNQSLSKGKRWGRENLSQGGGIWFQRERKKEDVIIRKSLLRGPGNSTVDNQSKRNQQSRREGGEKRFYIKKLLWLGEKEIRRTVRSFYKHRGKLYRLGGHRNHKTKGKRGKRGAP